MISSVSRRPKVFSIACTIMSSPRRTASQSCRFRSSGSVIHLIRFDCKNFSTRPRLRAVSKTLRSPRDAHRVLPMLSHQVSSRMQPFDTRSKFHSTSDNVDIPIHRCACSSTKENRIVGNATLRPLTSHRAKCYVCAYWLPSFHAACFSAVVAQDVQH